MKLLRNSDLQNKKLPVTLALVSLVGFIDSVYLTSKHYTGSSINCSIIEGCGEVLGSAYAEIFGIPLALLGALYYLLILLSSILYMDSKNKYALAVISYVPTFGFLFSLWLVYLQVFVIESYCQFCLLSALTSTILFIVSIFVLKKTK